MIYHRPLNQFQAEEANRFRIGQRVKINEDSTKPWIGDWLGVEATIHGVRINGLGEPDFTLLHDGNQVTDGFGADDLRALP